MITPTSKVKVNKARMSTSPPKPASVSPVTKASAFVRVTTISEVLPVKEATIVVITPVYRPYTGSTPATMA